MEQITVYAGIYTTWSKTGSISNAFHVSYGDPLFEWDEQWIFPLCLHASVGIILSSGCVKKKIFFPLHCYWCNCLIFRIKSYIKKNDSLNI